MPLCRQPQLALVYLLSQYNVNTNPFLLIPFTNNLQIVSNAVIETALVDATLHDKFQFLRMGYFCLDKYSTDEKLIFNKTVGLKDSWAKEIKK